jgi:signal transduction histidine kinase
VATPIEPPSAHPPEDRLAPFQRATFAIRLGALAASLVLAASELTDLDPPALAAAFALCAYTAGRLAGPLRWTSDATSLLGLGVEAALPIAAVASTGGWDSPFVLTLVTPVAVAGFAGGIPLGAVVGGVAITIVGLADLARADDASESLRLGGQWTAELLLVATVAGFARRMSAEVARQHSATLDRLQRLSEANALLFSLHRVAQTLPASLDLDEVLESTTGRLRELFDCRSAAVLLPDETEDNWHVARRIGPRLPTPLATADLPPPAQRATRQSGPIHAERLAERGRGLSPEAASGIYAGLWARGSLVGLVALEHGEEGHFGARDVELLEGFVEPAALAIDNARWFARLRTVGADEERTRIARDLHDRIGQSLAYLAFELDRLVKNASGSPMEEPLDQLRRDVRGVIREVRDTLYDLRTDVSETRPLSSTLEQFLDRVRDRSGLATELDYEEAARLPLPQEREMWRIAQEAITNVERHAEARTLRVAWSCDGRAATLTVADDGTGIPDEARHRIDSYGVLGMRERAASIGARIEIESVPGSGTTVRCLLEAA